VLALASEEANRTVKLAKDKGEDIIARDAIVEAAQGRAEQIIVQARAEAETIRLEADEYVIESLTELEAELNRLISQTRNGIAKLASERDILNDPRREQAEEFEAEEEA